MVRPGAGTRLRGRAGRRSGRHPRGGAEEVPGLHVSVTEILDRPTGSTGAENAGQPTQRLPRSGDTQPLAVTAGLPVPGAAEPVAGSSAANASADPTDGRRSAARRLVQRLAGRAADRSAMVEEESGQLVRDNRAVAAQEGVVRRRWRRRMRWSVRTRVLAALTALSALALLVAGTTAFVLERNRVDEGIEASLTRTSQEFLTLANEGVEPETGRPFEDVRELLLVGMRRIVPAPNEGMLGFVDGRVELQADPAYRTQLQQDPQLVTRLTEIARDADRSRLYSITTDTSNYWVSVVPIAGPSNAGALVLGYDRTAEHVALVDTYQTYALVALGAVVLIGGLGFLIVSDLLRPVALLRSAAARISSSDLSRRIKVVGNDDLAVLTTTVNTMLDRLEQAFSSQRELLDDVGHELRTPLTVVRGHLELMDPDDPQDAAAARAIALDELDRMNMLVEELVTLAKSRRPDFVTPVPTDVAMLTDEVHTKATPLGDRTWQLDGLAEVTAPLDPSRVTQALLQLASNAVKFSGDSSVVAIGSRADGEEVRMWVRDEGVGIAPEHQARVFERFERNDDRGIEGSGLGLTIVRSIAQAHGGRVELDSVPGSGTTVTMVLPMTTPDANDLEEVR